MVSFSSLVSGKMQVTGLLRIVWLMADPRLSTCLWMTAPTFVHPTHNLLFSGAS